MVSALSITAFEGLATEVALWLTIPACSGRGTSGRQLVISGSEDRTVIVAPSIVIVIISFVLELEGTRLVQPYNSTAVQLALLFELVRIRYPIKFIFEISHSTSFVSVSV